MSLQYFGFIQNVKRMHYQPLCVAELEDSGPSPLRLVQVCCLCSETLFVMHAHCYIGL